MTPDQRDTAARLRDGWTVPKPDRVPALTYAPATLALGVTFACFGVLTSYLFCWVGAGLMALALRRWIGELLHGQ
ncbi:MAG: hypothetical protein ACREQB_10245 [Candidatus Binataceae bacterium]